jgi:periplasmic protein TonB
MPRANPNVVALFSSDDYPVEAMRNGDQGRVIVDLRIGTNGRARSCRIVQSSGHQALDVKTCEIMLRRAKFSPARDAAGRAVEDTLRAPPIEWRLQEDPAPEPQPMAQ